MKNVDGAHTHSHIETAPHSRKVCITFEDGWGNPLFIAKLEASDLGDMMAGGSFSSCELLVSKEGIEKSEADDKEAKESEYEETAVRA